MTHTIITPAALRLLLATAIGSPPDSIAEDAARATMPAWDSFAHLNFMLALEQAYGITLSDASIQACSSLGGACEYVQQHRHDISA